MKKYTLLLDDTIEVSGITLHRIKALSSFNGVSVGDLGGYIEKVDNLSQYGDAWVSGNAKVFGDARVFQKTLSYYQDYPIKSCFVTCT